MRTEIIHFEIDNEIDVVLAHKRAIQIAELTGLTVADQTRFATAISEIARNCLEFACKGRIQFFINGKGKTLQLEAELSDNGPGIPNLEEVLARRITDIHRRGTGIVNAKKLVDSFEIDTCDTGTCVILGKQIPLKHPPINNIILKGWKEHFEKEVMVSPYEEIKKRNIQLLDLTDQLRMKNIEADLQIDEIKRLNQILEKKNENLKQIAYTLAHDLKNPLTTIRLSTEAAESAEELGEKDDFIKLVAKSGERIWAIIDGLQKNIEYDPDVALSADEVKLEAVAADLHEQFSPYLGKKKGNLAFNFSEVSTIKYPKVYLYSILSNLISNAVKYASDEPLMVNIRATKENKKVVLTVADNGIGMDMEKIGSNLFKPFHRFTNQAEGHGMGLSIVHYFITKNGGHIKVKSRPGKGTTFYCHLVEYVE